MTKIDPKSSVAGRMSQAAPRKTHRLEVLVWVEPLIMELNVLSQPTKEELANFARRAVSQRVRNPDDTLIKFEVLPNRQEG